MTNNENWVLVGPVVRFKLNRMRKLLITAGVIALGYYLFVFDDGSVGVYAEDGSPRTIMFVTEQCGRACVDMRKSLAKRIDFEEVDAFDLGEGSELYKEYGGTGYLPYVVMGKQRIIGHSPGAIISAIAAELGPSQVRESERRALERNFDSTGEPRIVMYATAWCGYCKKARQYFRDNGIAFVEYDIEKDRAASRDYNTLLGSGTPLLFQGYARISGFDVRRLEQEFDL